MDAFVYKCHNCGGKVDYNKEESKWICPYCGSSYASLFLQREDRKLPEVNNNGYVLYKNTCLKCNKSFISKKRDNLICRGCLSTDFSSEKIDVLFVANNKTIKDPDKYFKEELSYFQKLIFKDELIKGNFKREYISCCLFDGYVKVSCDQFEYKYFFINLLIPEIDDEDYRFMYEVARIGVKYLDTNIRNEDYIINELSNNINLINIPKANEYEKDVIEACIEDFKNKTNILNNDKIVVEDNLQKKERVYYPVYTKKVIYDGEVCNQYIISRQNKSGYARIVYQFPNVNKIDVIKEYKRIDKEIHILRVIWFIFFLLLFLVLKLSDMMSSLWVIFFVLLFIIIFIASILLIMADKEFKILEKTVRITKSNYYDQLINNTAYVRVLGGKK